MELCQDYSAFVTVGSKRFNKIKRVMMSKAALLQVRLDLGPTDIAGAQEELRHTI